jgi:transcriptional regulator of acetoin/glycerol metabolism
MPSSSADRDQGKPHLHGPGSDPSIARSWLRCLEDYHLDPALSMAPTVLEHGRVLESRERLQQVLQIAGSEMTSLHQQLSGAGHAVLLTDARGVILNCVTAPAERKISSAPACGSAPTGARPAKAPTASAPAW